MNRKTELWTNKSVEFSTEDMLDIIAYQEAIAFLTVPFYSFLSTTFGRVGKFLLKFNLLNKQQITSLPKCESGPSQSETPDAMEWTMGLTEGQEHIILPSFCHTCNRRPTQNKFMCNFAIKCGWNFVNLSNSGTQRKAPLCLSGYYFGFEATK